MALSGSSSTTFTNNSAFTIELSWTATQNVANNTSSVTATLKLKANKYYSEASGWYNKTAVININGTSESKSVNVNISPGDAPKTLFTKTVTVGHNADGTKSFNITASVDYTGIQWHGGKLGKVTTSGSYSLNTIPRATTPAVSPSTCNMDSAFTISLPRASSAFTHTVTMLFGNKNVTISTAATTSVTYTPKSSDFASQIPKAMTGRGTITVVTKNGSTTIGSKQIPISLMIPSSIKPSIGSISVADLNATVNTVLGASVYLQYLSQIKFTVNSPTASLGSTVSQTSLNFNGQSWNTSTATASNISKTGSLTCTATVIDGRGLIATKSVAVTITAYSSPDITTATILRDEDGFGSQLIVSRAGKFSSFSGKNTLSIEFQYKTSKSDTAWTTYAGLTKTAYSNTAGTFSFLNEKTVNSVYSFSKLTSYPWQIVVRDSLNQTTISGGMITTSEVAMSWGKNGVGIGKIWEQGSLDLANDIYIGGYARILASEASGSSGNTDIEAAPGKNISLGARSSGFVNFYRPTVFKGEADFQGNAIIVPRIRVHPTWTTWQLNEKLENGLHRIMLNQNPSIVFEHNNTKTANFGIGTDNSPRIWAGRGLYDRTYSDAVNMFVTSQGTIGRSTSASKYKLSIADIVDADQLSSNLLTVKPKSWFDKRQIEELADEMTEGVTKSEDSLVAKKYFGLIAEDLQDAGLHDYLSYNDETGEIEGIAYDRLWTLLIPSIRKHEEHLAEQKSINLDLQRQIKELQGE